MHGLRILCCDYCLTTISSFSAIFLFLIACFYWSCFYWASPTDTFWLSFLTTYHSWSLPKTCLSEKLTWKFHTRVEQVLLGWIWYGTRGWNWYSNVHNYSLTGQQLFNVYNYTMYLYVLFTFLYGHILVGLKRWFKEFCCTPKHMTRVKPELEWKANLGVDDSQDEVSYKLHLNVLKAESQ